MPRANTPQVASASGTVFTVAQLQRHYATGSLDERRARLRAPLFVKGTAVRGGDRWFLVQDDGTYVARISVSPGISLAAHDGREVVLAGSLKELPSSVAFLQDGRVVADPSGLAVSPLSDEDWLVRKGVPLDRVRTKPGGRCRVRRHRGRAVLGQGRRPAARRRLAVRPPRRAAALGPRRQASRDLEPQHWHRWKSAGGGKYLVRRADARGRLSEDWKPVTGMWRVKPWPDGKSIEGRFRQVRLQRQHRHRRHVHEAGVVLPPRRALQLLGFSQSGASSMAAPERLHGRADHGARHEGLADLELRERWRPHRLQPARAAATVRATAAPTPSTARPRTALRQRPGRACVLVSVGRQAHERLDQRRGLPREHIN